MDSDNMIHTRNKLVLRNEKDHELALKIIEQLMDASDKIEDIIGDLSVAIEQYEEIHYTIGKPSLIERIKFRIDQMRRR